MTDPLLLERKERDRIIRAHALSALPSVRAAVECACKAQLAKALSLALIGDIEKSTNLCDVCPVGENCGYSSHELVSVEELLRLKDEYGAEARVIVYKCAGYEALKEGG